MTLLDDLRRTDTPDPSDIANPAQVSDEGLADVLTALIVKVLDARAGIAAEVPAYDVPPMTEPDLPEGTSLAHRLAETLTPSQAQTLLRIADAGCITASAKLHVVKSLRRRSLVDGFGTTALGADVAALVRASGTALSSTPKP